MKKMMAVVVFFIFLSFTKTRGEHIQVCGDVYGIWNVDTVYVLCDITVPPLDTLVIEPGTIVLFQGYYKFSVANGAVLRALGSDSTFIKFDERFAGNGWHGIHFLNCSDSTRLEYCLIKHGFSSGEGDDNNGGGINILQSNITIQNCIIDSCNASNGGGIYSYNGSTPSIIGNTISYCSGGLGGGIFALNSSPIIKNSYFLRNSSSSGGGAINLTGSNAIVDSNYFIANSAWLGGGGGIKCESGSNAMIRYNSFDSNSGWWGGGGIYCATNSDATIRENNFTGNSADGIMVQDCNAIIRLNQIIGNGGAGVNFGNYSGRIVDNMIEGNNHGIYGGGGTPLILRNTIRNNSNMADGGGLRLSDCNPKIKRNVIFNNTANNGGGIYLERVNADSIISNTITDNVALQYGGAIYCNASNPAIQNCILFGNTAQGMSQIHPVNGSSPVVTYCDIQGGWFGEGNIDLPPLFRDAANDDYHLQSLTNPNCGGPANSPCIDTGNPVVADDTLYCDGGLGMQRSDMGTYGGGAIPTGVGEDSELPEEYSILSIYPNPFNPSTTIEFNLPEDSYTIIEIYDILGAKHVTLISEVLTAGRHKIQWRPDLIASGVYFCQLKSNGHIYSQKVNYLK